MLQEEQSEQQDENMQGRKRIANTIAQQIIYNSCTGSNYTKKSNNIRHNLDHETPFPLYMGLRLHGYGRQKQQINNANAFGISVSYKRVM